MLSTTAVTFAGNLASDPELRFTTSGKAVVELRVMEGGGGAAGGGAAPSAPLRTGGGAGGTGPRHAGTARSKARRLVFASVNDVRP